MLCVALATAVIAALSLTLGFTLSLTLGFTLSLTLTIGFAIEFTLVTIAFSGARGVWGTLRLTDDALVE